MDFRPVALLRRLRPATSEFPATVVLGTLLAGTVSALARARAAEDDARTEAALSARYAGLLQRSRDANTVLPAAARQLARTLGLPWASIEPGLVSADDRRTTFPLHCDGVPATLVVPAGLTRRALRRVRNGALPPLESLMRAVRTWEHAADDARPSYDRLRRIADEQAALRNLATLVARSAPPSEVFNAVAREMAHVLGTSHTVINRYEPDGSSVIVNGTWNYEKIIGSGTHWGLEKGTVSDLVFRTRAPGRVENYRGTGALSQRLRDRGVFSSVGCPIIVGDDLWGVAIASSSTPEPLPPDTEERMLEFSELAAICIANAQSHADLIASRARVITATDETRRRIERDLHDGTQQSLVSIGLEIRAMIPMVPPELDDIGRQLAKTAQALDEVLTELQEISRGLHPAILTRGGLKSALSVLAGRSAVPVTLDLPAQLSLPDHLQVTVYYIVAEALTNIAKHADATRVHVDVATDPALVRLSISDDGVGGADPARGSGLNGLIDRVVALGGRMRITSPAGEGTRLYVEIPLDTAASQPR
jgi:signal transduction histidine kinase